MALAAQIGPRQIVYENKENVRAFAEQGGGRMPSDEQAKDPGQKPHGSWLNRAAGDLRAPTVQSSTGIPLVHEKRINRLEACATTSGRSEIARYVECLPVQRSLSVSVNLGWEDLLDPPIAIPGSEDRDDPPCLFAPYHLRGWESRSCRIEASNRPRAPSAAESTPG